MISQGDNFRLVEGEVAAWALTQHFGSIALYPEAGTPRKPPEYMRNPKPRKTRPLASEALREKLGRAQTRRHAARLGLRLMDMGEYRYLRRIKGLTQDEAVNAVKQQRRVRK